MSWLPDFVKQAIPLHLSDVKKLEREGTYYLNKTEEAWLSQAELGGKIRRGTFVGVPVLYGMYQVATYSDERGLSLFSRAVFPRLVGCFCVGLFSSAVITVVNPYIHARSLIALKGSPLSDALYNDIKHHHPNHPWLTKFPRQPTEAPPSTPEVVPNTPNTNEIATVTTIATDPNTSPTLLVESSDLKKTE